MKKVTLLKDVLTPNNGVAHIGQTVQMSNSQAGDYIKKGLAEAAADDAEALPLDPAPEPAKPLTADTLKENADAATRSKKPAAGPDETK